MFNEIIGPHPITIFKHQVDTIDFRYGQMLYSGNNGLFTTQPNNSPIGFIININSKVLELKLVCQQPKSTITT